MEWYGLKGERNYKGWRFIAFCVLNSLAIVSTMFPPNDQCRNQIDHVVIRSNFKRSVQDVRAYRDADVGSDHNLVIAKTLLKLNRAGRKVHVVERYDTSKLSMPENRKRFQLKLRNRFSCLSIDDDEVEEGSGQESVVVLETYM